MRVLVIGDSCIDRFVRGVVNRLCPEAPVPVLNPFRVEENSGMAGNVYENIKRLAPSATVHFITQQNRIVKTRYVDDVSGYILLRVDEDGHCLKSLDLSTFIEKVESFGLGKYRYDAVVISDYNKGFLTEDMLKTIIETFEAAGVPVFLDTKKILGAWSKETSFVKINNKEYSEQLSRMKKPTDFCKNLIVTLGKEGSYWVNDGLIKKTNKVEVMDVSGAGDTYLAAFAIFYHETLNVETAMSYANKAAGIAVSSHGVVAVSRSQIK